MLTLLLIVLIVLALAGGGYGYHYRSSHPAYGPGPLWTVLGVVVAVCLVVLFVRAVGG